MKARLIIAIGWFLSNLHRFWNNSKPVEIEPFLFFDAFPLTIQWYVYLLSIKLFPACVLLAAYVGIRKKDYVYLGAVFALELVNYLLWYSESEFILFIQGLILLIGVIKWK